MTAAKDLDSRVYDHVPTTLNFSNQNKSILMRVRMQPNCVVVGNEGFLS